MGKVILMQVQRILFILLIFTLLYYSGCGSEKRNFPEPSGKAADGKIIFRTGIFNYGDKDYKADYGTVTVSESRNNLYSRLIHLPVIRIHSRSENPKEPVFGLAGGPGQSNMNWSPVDTLLCNHDFIMVGYRGVDGSTVLDCPEVADAFINAESGDLLSEESISKIGRAWKKSIDRISSQDIDLTGYTISETIEDIEVVRKALDYERINLISESYGTRVAYIYSLIHPDNILRSVMIGVNPPGHFIWEPEQTDRLLHHYAELWSKDSVMSKKSPDLIKSVRKVLDNIPRKWLIFSIDPGKVKVTAFCLLFDRNTAGMVFDSFIAAERGDYSGVALMSMAFDYTIPSMFVLGDLACKALSADFDSSKINIINKGESDILGSPMNKMLWGTLDHANLQVKLIPSEFRTFRQSDTETLLLSGNVDLSTPSQFAGELASYLKNGKHIIFSEFGHVNDIRYLRQFRTDLLIADFINRGIIDTAKIEYVPMDFRVDWGFPKIAKAVVGGVVILIIIFLLCLVLIIRKIKKRRRLKNIKSQEFND